MGGQVYYIRKCLAKDPWFETSISVPAAAWPLSNHVFTVKPCGDLGALGALVTFMEWGFQSQLVCTDYNFERPTETEEAWKPVWNVPQLAVIGKRQKNKMSELATTRWRNRLAIWRFLLFFGGNQMAKHEVVIYLDRNPFLGRIKLYISAGWNSPGRICVVVTELAVLGFKTGFRQNREKLKSRKSWIAWNGASHMRS